MPGTATSDSRGSERLNWLRGDPSSEGPTGTAFRQRLISKLGDIVNSSPTFVGAPNSGFGDPGYAAFRSQQLDRNPMIYVAANEGMMHGFRASDGVELLAYIPSKVHSRLNELTSKAYVGSAAHRYYVDATPTVGDAFISVGGPLEWRTVLVSSLGAGGQGLFALDVTNPGKVGNPADAGDFAETAANAAKVVLWEFNDTDDPNLGYIIGQPIIRKMANDRWAAIVSGGYNNSEGKTPDNPAVLGEAACTDSTGVIGAVTSATVVPPNCTTSTTGQAYLFIIFLDGPTGANRTWINGTDYIRIPTGAGSVGTPNGLASPAGLDTNIDGKVDFIYAGDLLGNLFKFDVRSPTPGNWANPTNQVVLFTATVPGTVPPQPQPITSIPDGTLHPTGKGFIIAFGTGKYLEPTDPNAPYAVQSYYGIWDKNDALVPPAVASPNPISTQTTVTSRTQLLEQTITNVTSGGTSFRVLSNNVPVWSQDTSPPVADDSPSLGRHMGWFMNFPSADKTGERSVFGPILTGGRLIFTTLLPNAAACEAGGSSFLMVVSPGTGGRIDAPVLETNNDGTLNSSDKVLLGSAQVFVSGVQTKTGITNTPTIIKAGAAMGGPGLPGAAEQTGSATAGATADPRVAIMGGSKVSNIANELIGFSATSGRVSWREILAE